MGAVIFDQGHISCKKEMNTTEGLRGGPIKLAIDELFVIQWSGVQLFGFFKMQH